jgi:imidazolonepropionase-like amidohydrolase
MGNSRIPGISLHREMQLFVDAGVPPYKALLGSTRYAAEMMRMADTIGTLEEGKQADIVVLGANPVQDIAATQDLRYVIRKGRIVRSASVSGE